MRSGMSMRRKRVRAGLVAGNFLFVCASSGDAGMAAPPTPVDWVDPSSGTAGSGSEYGGTMPLVTTPFGMINWTAQTRRNRLSVSSCNYADTHIQGFIGTHHAAIWTGDYGYVSLMPELAATKFAPEARQLPFARNDEVATPYCYVAAWMPATNVTSAPRSWRAARWSS
jgi:putative alpha-1,2-mannosidase